MFQKFLSWIRQVVSKMLGASNIKQATHMDVDVSSDMIVALEQWDRMYRNEPDWKNSTTVPLGLPAAIAGELARLTVLEVKSEVSGSTRAEYINEQYKHLLAGLQQKIEQGCALGGMAFKPYPTDAGQLVVDCVPADRFFPTGFDSSGNLSGGVFVDRYTRGRQFYTRFECHQLTGTTYTIKNVAYMSYDRDSIGVPVSLDAAPQWAGLDSELTLDGITRPLFGYFRVPTANNIDRDSPLGVSVYARAVDTIRQADEQWSRMLWEFEGTELAVDISAQAFMPDENGGVKIPKRFKRLFRALDLGDSDNPLYQVFSPQIREEPLYKGLQHVLQLIEFQCGLAYGTLSDPQTVEKTAEEIKASKQRSYSTVASLQAALEHALNDVVYAMDVWATINHLAPAGKYEVSFGWDDSIVVDTDKEFAQRMQMASAQYIRPELLLSWYFGCSEEEARKMMPVQTDEADPFGLNGDA